MIQTNPEKKMITQAFSTLQIVSYIPHLRQHNQKFYKQIILKK